MFNLGEFDVKKLHNGKQDKDTYFSPSRENDFPIKNYIERNYNCCACFFYPDENYNYSILHHLFKYGKLLYFTTVGNLNSVIKNPIDGLRGGSLWFEYKNVFIKITLKDQPDEMNDDSFVGSLSYPPNTKFLEHIKDADTTKDSDRIFYMAIVAPVTVQKYPLEDFQKFIVKKQKGRINVFIKNQYGDFSFESIKLNNSDDINIGLNYGQEFTNINDTIISRLNKNTSGLYMFHGSPGTGKTTYIKYLATQVNRDFIYIPTNMLEYFTTDPSSISILLTKPNSVLVLEDAEKAILKREDGGSTSSVSSLLNLSDGIMSDIMKTAIILTYNCPKNDVDDALRRKGRLHIDYEFRLLKKEDAINLAKTLNFSDSFIEEKITEDISLADVYNLQIQNDFQSKKETKTNKIGF